MENSLLTRYSHFEYQVMPFGLTNAPGSFQGYVNKILAEKLDVFVIVYLDDILVYTEDPGQGHIEAVRWVLEALKKYGLYANLKKCRFHQDKVRFLGFVVSTDGIRMEEERIEAIKKWPEPKSVQDIQVFIGFANFYRRFIQGFSRIATPLIAILKTTGSSAASASGADGNEVGGGGADGSSSGGGSSVSKGKSAKSKSRNSGRDSVNSDNNKATEESSFLTSEAREAFNRLKQVFTEAPILRHFDPECHIRIETDASGYAIGGVLSQLTPNQLTSEDSISPKSVDWHPVAYFSRKMISAETRYETHDGELLAIVEAFKTWRHYLEGCKHEVLVLTDHNNLRQFMDTKSLSSRQVRWAQELSRYHFRIDYRQGKANAAADALFRYPQRNQEEEELLRAENTRILYRLQSSLTNASLLGLTLSESSLSPLHQVLVCGTNVLPQLRQFWDNFRSELADEGPYTASIGRIRLRLQELQKQDDFARKTRADGLGDKWEDVNGVLHYQELPYIPEIIKTEVISRHHDDPLAGHFGINKTRELVARKYYWPSFRYDVEVYVKGCDVCLASKAVRHKPYGDLQSLPIPTHRWKNLSMDFVTGLPTLTD